MRTVSAETAGSEDWEYVLSCLRKYGENSMCYLDLEPDKTWLISESVEGFAGCAVSGHGLIVCGDPVCDSSDLAAFMKELEEYAKPQHLETILLFVLEKNLPVYHSLGMGCYKTGEEATFNVQNWSISGGKMAKVRSSWHTAQHYGLTVSEYMPWESRDPEIERQFTDITRQWLQEKHTSQLQFCVGSLMFDRKCDKRYFYAADPEGVSQGINVLNPYCSGKGWIVDIMRRRDGSPHGVMELLFHDIMEKIRAEGALYASLGVAPFFNTMDEDHPALLEKQEHYIFDHMNYIYGFKPLQEAKAKFQPMWTNVYLICHPKHMTPWMDMAALSVLDSQGFSDYVHAFLEMQKAKWEAEAK